MWLEVDTPCSSMSLNASESELQSSTTIDEAIRTSPRHLTGISSITPLTSGRTNPTAQNRVNQHLLFGYG
jgi:hypothetical protein